MLNPHLADIERWLAAEPRLTALAILGRLAEQCPEQFGPPQHTIVQRLLRRSDAKQPRRSSRARLRGRHWPVIPGLGSPLRVMGTPRRPQSLRSCEQ